MTSPRRAAHSSTANSSFTSVAVETAACPPVMPAMIRAKSFAPPTWPDSRGTTNLPASSTLTTAGSVNLSRTWGAMARTAMPEAPTNTSASSPAKCSAVHVARLPYASTPISSAKRAGPATESDACA